MTMTLSLAHSIEPDGSFEQIGITSVGPHVRKDSFRESFHLLRSKLEAPHPEGLIERPRIRTILSRSVDQFPATLISGRSGTGKTAIAASFAASEDEASWYTVESADRDWPVFSRYFRKLVTSTPEMDVVCDDRNEPEEPSEFEVAKFVLESFKRSYTDKRRGRRLLVLDDVHHIFDAAWFDDFFELLLYSLPEDHRLLMLCRSRPPGPLWRLRSKQMLNVIDEKVIEFKLRETEELFGRYGLSPALACAAHRPCYGRISRLLQFAQDAAADGVSSVQQPTCYRRDMP